MRNEGAAVCSRIERAREWMEDNGERPIPQSSHMRGRDWKPKRREVRSSRRALTSPVYPHGAHHAADF